MRMMIKKPLEQCLLIQDRDDLCVKIAGAIQNHFLQQLVCYRFELLMFSLKDRQSSSRSFSALLGIYRKKAGLFKADVPGKQALKLRRDRNRVIKILGQHGALMIGNQR